MMKRKKHLWILSIVIIIDQTEEARNLVRKKYSQIYSIEVETRRGETRFQTDACQCREEPESKNDNVSRKSNWHTHYK
jgi:hypothetical protein